MQQRDANHNQQNAAELHKTQSFCKKEVAEARSLEEGQMISIQVTGVALVVCQHQFSPGLRFIERAAGQEPDRWGDAHLQVGLH